MSQQTAEHIFDWRAAIENLITEDDEPVDNIPSAKQQRLLVTPLYDCWTPPPSEEAPGEERKFLADANIGIFRTPYDDPTAGCRRGIESFLKIEASFSPQMSIGSSEVALPIVPPGCQEL